MISEGNKVLKPGSLSAGNNKPTAGLSNSDLCANNMPFSTCSMKLSFHDKKPKLSATLPNLSHKKVSNGTIIIRKNSNMRCSTSKINNNNLKEREELRKSVSSAKETLKLAIAKSMPRPLPKEKKVTRKSPIPDKHHEEEEGYFSSENKTSPKVSKSLTEADLRQIAVERANLAIKKQRMREMADKVAAELDRRSRAEVIELKKKQRERYRAEVYAVNAILKRMEMNQFDELRQQRGSDRSFLENCSSEDDSSVEDKPDDSEIKTNSTGATKAADNFLNKSTQSQSKLSRVATDLIIKEPAGLRPHQSSTRKVYVSCKGTEGSRSAEVKARSVGEDVEKASRHFVKSSTDKIALEVKYACPPHYVDNAPPSTSESEVCNFSFGV